MIIVQNRLQVKPEYESEFVRRVSEGDEAPVPGRLFAARMKAEEPGIYINLSVWEDRAAYEAWRKSEAFHRVHSGGPEGGVVMGPPQLTIAEVFHSEGSLSALATPRA